MHLAVCLVLYKNRSVTHVAGEDYDYDDDQDEEMYEDGFGIVIHGTASNVILVFYVSTKGLLFGWLVYPSSSLGWRYGANSNPGSRHQPN